MITTTLVTNESTDKSTAPIRHTTKTHRNTSSLVPNDLTVFANEPIHSIPIYAPMVIQTVNDIVMSFDEFIWNPEEVSLTEYSPPLEMNNIKRADFHVPNATVTANYSPTDGLTNRKVNQLVPESTLFRW